MKKIKSIQLKAAFLLIAFSLNTVIGLACAVGMKMDFNTHDNKEVSHHQLSEHQSSLIHHKESIKYHDHHSQDQDNCCHDKVTKISKLDKAVPQSFSTSVNSIFLLGLASSFYNIDLLNSLRNTAIRYIARSHHPPIPDIRIAIRSFQI